MAKIMQIVFSAIVLLLSLTQASASRSLQSGTKPTPAPQVYKKVVATPAPTAAPTAKPTAPVVYKKVVATPKPTAAPTPKPTAHPGFVCHSDDHCAYMYTKQHGLACNMENHLCVVCGTAGTMCPCNAMPGQFCCKTDADCAFEVTDQKGLACNPTNHLCWVPTAAPTPAPTPMPTNIVTKKIIHPVTAKPTAKPTPAPTPKHKVVVVKDKSD